MLASQTELSTITIQLHPAPDLRIERRLPDQYAMHESFTFPITIANHGTVELRQIEVHDRLAGDMIFEQASPPGAYDPAAHRVVWSIDRLAAGEAREVWFRARLEGDGAPMQLTAAASTKSLVRDADEDQAEVMLPFFVDLSVVKDGERAVPLGREATYFLSFRNHGNGDAQDVRLVERLPEGMTFVRADGGGSYDASQRAVVWILPKLLPGGGGDVTYVARIDQAAGRLQTETLISSAAEDRADVDNRVVTFLTALPEEFADRDVWSPGTTARDAVDALSAVGRWLANAGIVVGIVVAPIAAAVGVLGLGVLGIRRRIRRRSDTP